MASCIYVYDFQIFTNQPCAHYFYLFTQIYGCAPFEIDFNSFKIYKYPGYGTIRFTMEASVKERATGITLNATKVEKTVEKTDVKLSFSGTSDIFKPGLPFNAVVRII